MVPWVHVERVAGMMLFVAQTASIAGPFNAVSPHPVTNREFTARLAHQLHRPAILRAPYFGLRLAFGEMASMLVGSQRAVPKAAEAAAYQFRFPDLQAALADIFSPK